MRINFVPNSKHNMQLYRLFHRTPAQNPEFPPGPSQPNWAPFVDGPADDNDFPVPVTSPGWLSCDIHGMSNEEEHWCALKDPKKYFWRNIRTPGMDGQLYRQPLDMSSNSFKAYRSFMY